MPPIYWSTGIQYDAASLSNGTSSELGEQYLKKYQDESTKVSMVSVSLRAAPPHLGHVVSIKVCEVASGLPLPVNSTS